MSYPEDEAVETWIDGVLQYSIVRTNSDDRHYCGYVRFPKRPLKEQGYDGVVTYVPVHGGVTFAREDADGMVYGFDCAHAGDERDPRVTDLTWLRAECGRLASGIVAAIGVEESYLLAGDASSRAAVIDEYHATLADRGINFELTDNFGAMINALTGSI